MSISRSNQYLAIFFSISFLFLMVYVYCYPRPDSADDLAGYFIYNDDSVTSFFLMHFADSGCLKIPVPYLDQFSPDITIAFTPRDVAQYDGFLVPKYFLGTFFGIGTSIMLYKDIFLIYTPIFTVLMVFGLFLLTRQIFGKIIALISSIIAFGLPCIIIWGSRFDTIGAVQSTFFLLMGFFYFIKFVDTKENRFCLLFTIFFSVSVYYRYPNAMFIIPFVFYILIIHKDIITKQVILLGVVVPVLILIQVLFLNKELYGDYLTTGYLIASRMIGRTLPGTVLRPDDPVGYITSIFGINLGFMMKYLSNYLIYIMPLISFGSLLGSCQILKHRSKNHARYLLGYSLYLLIVILVFYGSHPTSGIGEFIMSASFIRYLLPLYLLIIPAFAYFLIHLSRTKKYLTFVIIFVLIVGHISFSFSSPAGIIDRFNAVSSSKVFSEFVMNTTQPEGLILTQYTDKSLIPDRNIIVAIFLAPPSNGFDFAKDRFYTLPPDEGKIAYNLSLIANKNIPIYITDEFNEAKLNEQFSTYGYKLDAVDPSTSANRLYKLSKYA